MSESTPPPSQANSPELVVLEALQIAYAGTGAAQYLRVYEQLRQRTGQRHAPASEGGPGPQPVASGPTRMRVVCATRKDRETFFSATALGRSLAGNRPPGVELRLFPRNSEGLPAVYNRAIAESLQDEVIFLFVHDDVHLCDFHWASRLASGLSAFDLLGLVGNRRRVPGQTGWLFLDEKLTRDSSENLSGVIGHGRGFPPDSVDAFGPAGQAVKLLDGVLLAVTSTTLRTKALRFDERFNFHFYDLDFCRQAEQAGLRIGTWPVSVVHESEGSFANDGWRRAYEAYVDKWGD